MARKEILGSIKLDFISHTQVRITDTLPDPTHASPYNIAFPFMLAVRLIGNYPSDQRASLVSRAFGKIQTLTSGLKIDALDIPLHRIFCDDTPEIVDTPGKVHWAYAFQFIKEGEGFRIHSDIGMGEEDYFHALSIDTVFEHLRLKWGLKALLIPFEQELLKRISAFPQDLSRSYGEALEVGVNLWGIVQFMFGK